MLQTLVNNLLEIAMVVISGLITGFVIPKFVAWLNSKTANQKIRTVITDIQATVTTTVDSLEQTMVKQLKADGRWDSASQQKVLQVAANTVVNNLNESTTKYLANNSQDIQDTVVRYIQAYILNQKKDK